MTTMVQHAVIDYKGIWPHKDKDGFRYGQLGVMIWRSEFESEAKRMGYINGYLWDKEYPTDGKRPDLPDDVLITIKRSDTGEKFAIKRQVKHNDWDITDTFCIVDPRYKPVDEVGEISESKPNAESASEILVCKQKAESVSEWWDYENDCIIEGRYPPIGTKCKYSASAFKYETCEIVAVNYPEVAFTCKRNEGRIFVDKAQSAGFRPLDHATRKAELDREKFIDAAMVAIGQPEVLEQHVFNYFGLLFDAGFQAPKGDKNAN